MQQLMPRFRGNGMPLGDGQLWTDGDVQFRMQPMPYPPDAHLGDLLDIWRLLDCLRDVREHRGVDPI